MLPPTDTPRPPRILAIAGSDSSGGAGIQADIKTITMLGGYAMTAITAITAQNTTGVSAIHPVPGSMIAEQIAACVDDVGADAVKIGMLADEATVAVVAEALQAVDAPIVVDPVMVATSGAVLTDDAAMRALTAQLLPRAALVTPNLPEMARLTGLPTDTTEQIHAAAHHLAERCDAPVLAKGGHDARDPLRVHDYLVWPDGAFHSFDHARIDTTSTHGTGCTLSSAIATLLGHGQALPHAVRLGREFVRRAIAAAPGYGVGHGPLGHQAVRG